MPLLLILLLAAIAPVSAQNADSLMRLALERHQNFPFAYEKQRLLMTDYNGNRSVRQIRRYWRTDSPQHSRFLLVVDYPVELKGVALLAESNGQEIKTSVYLPAFGNTLLRPSDTSVGQRIPGTDLALHDLRPEDPGSFNYTQLPQLVLDKVPYWVIEAKPAADTSTRYSHHHHYIRQDNLFIERTEYFDSEDQLLKRRSHLNIRPLAGDSWQSSRLLVEDLKARHSTLISVEERTFSEDYVPPALFEAQTLFSQRHLQSPELWAARPAAEQQVK